jgi:ATP-dependent helicase HrpB
MISLPIDTYLQKISDTLQDSANLVLTASPGSGKTTRVPPTLLKTLSTNKKIIVLVPKRIAAVSAANRIAEEQGFTLGQEVGYQVRFDNRTSAKTKLIFMTEGVFIKKIADENFWQQIEIIVFDEFHERSSHIDLALGISLERQIMGQNLKLLVMSATLNAEKLLNYLPDSKLIDVENRPFKLEVIKSKKGQRLICDQVFADQLIETLSQGLQKSKKDALVFLPGLGEIRYIERQLSSKFSQFEVAILHGSIRLEEQRKVLQPANTRRIILSTNIAESSLTIPSVDLVIDSGLEKKSITEGKIGFKRLELARISLFSAQQRAGRAARVSDGFCYQLWHELDERSMLEQIEPQILTSDLLEETLTLAALDIKAPDKFSWVDRPARSFRSVQEQLQKWQLLDINLSLTPKGKLVQHCPLDIEKSLLFVELSLQGHQKQASQLLAFIETTAFDNLNQPVNLDDLFLNDIGKKIEAQLQQISISGLQKANAPFKETLIQIYFQFFANKIAQKKEKNSAVSSLGRGLEMASYLVKPEHEYYLLMAGREISSALTRCDFAIGFTLQEFEKMVQKELKTVTDTALDIEKRRIYKIEKKVAGYFTISESARIYVDEYKHPDLFKDYITRHFSELLSQHDDYKNYVTKISFLQKRISELDVTLEDFKYLNNFESEVLNSVTDSVRSLEEFFNFNLFDILAFFTPDQIKNLLQQLPNNFKLPNGKMIKIDYASEQAPKISAKLQEMFGQKTNPTLLGGKIRMTVELLAPNYRPTQITSQLENFWTTSYFEIRKELKARYPKHAWPDNPSEVIIPEWKKPAR